MTSPGGKRARVAIIGGGLAGLAAAVALVPHVARVELFEARRRLGGRAGSFDDPTTGEPLDLCQHVSLGCCTNFARFCRTTGIEDLFTRHPRLHFFGPEGTRRDLAAARWLPAPLHLAPSLARMSWLSWRDQLAIARGMLRLMRCDLQGAEEQTVADWLQARNMPAAAVERFWQVVLISALGEDLPQASLAAARKVFRDGFLAHPAAADVLVPRVTLGELYDRRVADWLRERGAALHLATPVESLVGDAAGVRALRVAGEDRAFDDYILAVPWRRAPGLLGAELAAAAAPELARVDEIRASPISSVHLWFDRPLTPLPHAVLVGRLSQWVFARPADAARPEDAARSPAEHYYQVVISASHSLAGRESAAIIAEVQDDLRALFPAATDAVLLRARLLTDPQAVFSCRPGLESLRPAQTTRVPNLFLAGDWTRTGWPATMEGAVRSGFLAADAVLRRLDLAPPAGSPLASDLPLGWLARRLLGPPLPTPTATDS